jgi:hypothetical protein
VVVAGLRYRTPKYSLHIIFAWTEVVIDSRLRNPRALRRGVRRALPFGVRQPHRARGVFLALLLLLRPATSSLPHRLHRRSLLPHVPYRTIETATFTPSSSDRRWSGEGEGGAERARVERSRKWEKGKREALSTRRSAHGHLGLMAGEQRWDGSESLLRCLRRVCAGRRGRPAGADCARGSCHRCRHRCPERAGGGCRRDRRPS